jgi:hypothetical protein
VSLTVMYSKNLRSKGRRQTRSLVLRGLLEEVSEAL